MLDEKDRKMKTSLFSLTDFNWNQSIFLKNVYDVIISTFNIDKQNKRRRNSLIVIKPILLIWNPPMLRSFRANDKYGERTRANR